MAFGMVLSIEGKLKEKEKYNTGNMRIQCLFFYCLYSINSLSAQSIIVPICSQNNKSIQSDSVVHYRVVDSVNIVSENKAEVKYYDTCGCVTSTKFYLNNDLYGAITVEYNNYHQPWLMMLFVMNNGQKKVQSVIISSFDGNKINKSFEYDSNGALDMTVHYSHNNDTIFIDEVFPDERATKQGRLGGDLIIKDGEMTEYISYSSTKMYGVFISWKAIYTNYNDKGNWTQNEVIVMEKLFDTQYTHRFHSKRYIKYRD
jgi:hypothetical protein